MGWRLRRGRGNNVFFIDSVFCQLGNNIQQILVALAHVERFGGHLSMSSSFLDHLKEIDIAPERLPGFLSEEEISSDAVVYRANFFHYSDHALFGSCRYSEWKPGFAPVRSSLLDEQHIQKSSRSIAYRSRSAFWNLVRPSQSQNLGPSLLADHEVLILHLRAGDVSALNKAEYATNPLCYYECLSRTYRRVVVVTQPGPDHVLLPSILQLFDSASVVRGDSRDDFSLLANSPSLATSGVSTYAIAAALLSLRLERLYASDVFLREHLNPLYLRSYVDVQLFRMPGFFRLWKQSTDRRQLLYRYRPPISKFSHA